MYKKTDLSHLKYDTAETKCHEKHANHPKCRTATLADYAGAAFFDSSHARHRILARGKASVVENPAMTTAPTAIAAHPVETPSSLTLEECYAKAGTNYPLVSRYGLIQQSEQYSLSNANKGYLPQFSLSAKATYQTDVTKIPVSIPGVDIPTLNKDQYQALVELDQVIWDGGTIRSQKRNINASTEVDRQQQQVDMYAIRERINSLFFGTLLLEEQLKLNTLYDEELARNYQKVQSFIANGVANAPISMP